MEIRIVNHRIQRIAAVIAQAAIEMSAKDEVVNQVLRSHAITPEEIDELKQALSDHARHMAEAAELHSFLAMEEGMV